MFFSAFGIQQGAKHFTLSNLDCPLHPQWPPSAGACGHRLNETQRLDLNADSFEQ